MTMHAAQKEFLEEHFAAKDWLGRSDSGRKLIKEFRLAGSEVKGWKILKMKHAEEETGRVIRSLWGHGDSTNELLSIDIFLCASVKAAHEALLEALSNMESGAIERKKEKNAPGDVAFGLGNTLVVFARANVTFVLRNAGPSIVAVGAIARELDGHIQRRLDAE